MKEFLVAIANIIARARGDFHIISAFFSNGNK